MVRGLVVAVCGILLGIGGCLGFLATYDAGEALAGTLGIVFAIGAIVASFGVMLFIVGVLKWFFGLFTAQSGQ
jgi:hypothetical protein